MVSVTRLEALSADNLNRHDLLLWLDRALFGVNRHESFDILHLTLLRKVAPSVLNRLSEAHLVLDGSQGPHLLIDHTGLATLTGREGNRVDTGPFLDYWSLGVEAGRDDFTLDELF